MTEIIFLHKIWLALLMILVGTGFVIATLFALWLMLDGPMTDAEFIYAYGDLFMTAVGAVSLVWLWCVVRGRS